MKLALILLAMLAFPLATMWAENREDGEEKRRVDRMADRDRRSQAVRPMSRRMRYATIGGKLKKPCGSGSSHKATRKTHILSIAGNGGKVNG